MGFLYALITVFPIRFKFLKGSYERKLIAAFLLGKQSMDDLINPYPFLTVFLLFKLDHNCRNNLLRGRCENFIYRSNQ